MSKVLDFLRNDISFLRKNHQKKYIYGTHLLAKNALLWLAKKGIYIDGFVVEEESLIRTLFHKPVILLQEMESPCVIIDFSLENNGKRNWHKECQFVQLCRYKKGTPVIIYGAGVRGREIYEHLSLMDVNVLCFADKDSKKWETLYCGKKVISPEILKKDFRTVELILGVSDDKIQAVAEQLSDVFSQMYFHRNDITNVPYVLWRSDRGIDFRILEFYYLQHFIIEKGKKLVLFGKRCEVSSLFNLLYFFDIPVFYAVDQDGYVGVDDGVIFRDWYDLLYETTDTVSVLTFPESRELILNLIEENKMDLSMFSCLDSDGIVKVDRYIALDPSLGYTFHRYHDDFSMVMNGLQECPGQKKIKIGILGGSTSDINYFNIKSWPELFLELLADNNISAEIYAGGMSGQIVSQEVVRFIRDFSHQNLDLVISYSGANEPHAVEENRFIHSYQKTIFSMMGKYLHQEIYYGNGISNPMDNWIFQEKILHDICALRGIRFYAIFQPNLYFKSNISLCDAELLEYLGYYRYFPNPPEFKDYSKIIQTHKEMRKKIKAEQDRYSWMKDFTQIFDDMQDDIYMDDFHLTETGNQILAGRMYELLKDDIHSML